MMKYILLLATLSVSQWAGAVVLETERSGVYRLPKALLAESDVLTNRGRIVPITVDQETGDGLFVAERISGESKWFHPYQTRNVYWLGRTPDVDEPRPVEVFSGQALARSTHLETDELLIRISHRDLGDEVEPETWYWGKLNHIDKSPFIVNFDLPDLKTPGQARIQVGFRGISRPHRRLKGDVSEHEVSVTLNGQPLESLNWDGKGAVEFELGSIGPELLQAEKNSLEFKIPRRQQTDGNDMIDVAMLDWVRVTHEVSGLVDAKQLEFLVPADATVVELTSDEPLRVFAYSGKELAVEQSAPGQFAVKLDGPTSRIIAVQSNNFLEPLSRKPAGDWQRLLRKDEQADYLMIAHPRLMAETVPLAEFHRQRGLSVKIIDVMDIYDAFNHGLTHHQAIKDFITHAWANWEAPRPQNVLLVGDSSWDRHNKDGDDARYANWANQPMSLMVLGKFMAKKGGGLYGVPEGFEHRDLIPTWQYNSNEGHSASDNWYVDVEGDDFAPELAIGRFPVVEPEEVAAIVDKTISYVNESEVGPWRRNVLWITNEQKHFQQRSDKLANEIGTVGYASSRVYPVPEELDNAEHQVRLQDAFNEGQALVHFIGHGGRFIWRTGPPDIRKNHDLFTLEHIDGLAETNRLAMVLSMTCFSAPFDHPTHDSIGEKFLRVPGRGAVAILGASWRNSPQPQFSEAIVREMVKPGVTVGEAIRRAKNETRSHSMIATYNLLGDPAIEMVKPSLSLSLKPAGQRYTATVQGVSEFEGKVVAEWVDDKGEVSQRVDLDVDSPEFELPMTENPVSTALRVYVWNEEQNIDGAGVLSLVEDMTAPVSVGAGGR